MSNLEEEKESFNIQSICDRLFYLTLIYHMSHEVTRLSAIFTQKKVKKFVTLT